jgi:hypothetical protein
VFDAYVEDFKIAKRAHPLRSKQVPRPAGYQTQLADDAMIIVTRSCPRALSSQLSHAVSATVTTTATAAHSAQIQ